MLSYDYVMVKAFIKRDCGRNSYKTWQWLYWI